MVIIQQSCKASLIFGLFVFLCTNAPLIFPENEDILQVKRFLNDIPKVRPVPTISCAIL